MADHVASVAPRTRLARNRDRTSLVACSCGGGCPRCRSRGSDGSGRSRRVGASSPGIPLSDSVRTEFETIFDADLRAVRVHNDARAAEVAKQMDVKALTVGNHIAFDAGVYRPELPMGRRLLAHELVHVIQRQNAGFSNRTSPISTSDSQRAEAEARSLADAVSGGGRRVGPVTVAAPDEPLMQRRSRPRVRFPTLEIFAAQAGGALGGPGMPLTSREMTLAGSVFGSSIDLDQVRIVVSRVAAAPTTLGNNIRIPPRYSMPDRILIHELMHIWQYQTRGSAYISDSAWHQTTAWLTRGGRGAAYTYTITPGRGIDEYPAEHQASIVEDYYAYPALRANPEYQRLIAEVRSARPVSQAFRLEEAAGLLGESAVPPSVDTAPVAPLFRLEF